MRLANYCFPLVSLLLAAGMPTTLFGGALCGPGSHWVDRCAGGLYNFVSTTYADVSIDLDRDGSLETVIPALKFTGVTDVYLGTGSPHTIQDEIVRILETSALFGMILRAGDGVGNLVSDGPLHSPGHIDEQAGNEFLADSFFDVFLEVEIPLPTPMILRNRNPLQVVCTGLTQAPPAACDYYDLFPGTLNLYEGQELRAVMSTPLGFPHHHVDIPEPAALGLVLAGLGALALRARRRCARNR